MRASLLPLLLSIFVVASASSSSFGLSSNEPALDEGESKTSNVDPAILFLVIGGDVDEEPADIDNDGIEDGKDQCPDSDLDAAVDLNGCTSSQLDEDNDGVSDAEDQCPNSSVGVTVDIVGCEDLSISVREVYETDVNPLIVSQSGGCTSSGCHGRANAPGGLRLYPLSNSNNVQLNYNAFVSYIDSRSGNALLGKISGTSGHGGGTRYSSTSTQYQIIEDWVRSVEALP